MSENKYLHIVSGEGWYIDNCNFTNNKILENSSIKRESNYIDILNNPCIYVMSVCNGSCQYCYQNGHLKKATPNLSFEDIFYFISELNKIQDNNFPKTIELFGGEPLLRKDIVPIIELLKSYGYKILIATNGTLPILGNPQFHKIIKKDVHIRIVQHRSEKFFIFIIVQLGWGKQ